MEGQQLTKKQNIMQSVKFVLISASAGIIQLGVSTILVEVFHPVWAVYYLPPLLLSVLWNFTINRRYNFKSAANIPKAMLLVLAYYCVFTPLSLWWGVALEKAGWNEYLILAPTMIVNMVTEFLFCRFVVYRNNMNTNDIAKKEEEKEKSK